MMNLLIQSLLLISLFSSSFCEKVKIMTFNIDCRVCDFKGEHGTWRERVENEKDTMQRYNPDLIGIQEPIFKSDVDELLPKGYKALYFNESDWLPWGVYPDATIFYRDSRFIPKDFQMFWLGPNSSFPAGFDRLALPRLAVYARFYDKLDGTEFYFGSTHFDHGDDMSGNNIDCTASAKELLSFTEPIAKDFPFIWTGDFNSETANNNAYSILTNSSADFHLDDTYFNCGTHVAASNQNPPPEYDYNQSIDHIFFANNLDVASYKVLDWTVDMYVYGEQQQYASDHWALISTIDIKSIK